MVRVLMACLGILVTGFSTQPPDGKVSRHSGEASLRITSLPPTTGLSQPEARPTTEHKWPARVADGHPWPPVPDPGPSGTRVA